MLKGHSRGVVTIEYSPSQRFIVSAGFDHDILVWSPIAGQVYKNKIKVSEVTALSILGRKPADFCFIFLDGRYTRNVYAVWITLPYIHPGHT